MGANLSIVGSEAILSAAENCREISKRQDSADPLWFAVMCRAIWGANAAKELRFIIDKSERTCRAWVSGDSEPPASVLRALQRSEEYGAAFQAYVMQECLAAWWQEQEAARDLLRTFNVARR